jgi:hypothetical protein
MDGWHVRRLVISLTISLCTVMILPGCGGGGSSTAPFSALTIHDGTGSAAKFNTPAGIVSDGLNLYVADTTNQSIRRVVKASGDVKTLAGSTGVIGSTDATGIFAKFNFPYGIASDGTNLYVSDTANQTIRMVAIATDEVTTLAGTVGSSGKTDGTGPAALFNHPFGITTDRTNLYVADRDNGTIRQIVIATGEVTTLAGTAGATGTTDGTGPAAQFKSPSGITTDGTNLYVADTANNTIRKVVIASGVVTTLAGTAGTSGSTDGTGTAALFKNPYGITTDGTNLYVADSGNNAIRQIVIATGVVTTLAGGASAS